MSIHSPCPLLDGREGVRNSYSKMRRTVDAGTPVRTLYDLTENGRALIPVLKGIEDLARAWSDS